MLLWGKLFDNYPKNFGPEQGKFFVTNETLKLRILPSFGVTTGPVDGRKGVIFFLILSKETLCIYK